MMPPGVARDGEFDRRVAGDKVRGKGKTVKRTSIRSLVAWTSGLVGSAAVASAVVVGCGGDDTGGGPSDASADQTGDVVNVDGSQESGVDGGTDSPGDSPVGDSPTDGGGRMDADATTPPPTADTFVGLVAQALCERVRECCLIDAGGFDLQTCLNDYGTNPLGLGIVLPYIDGGTVTFDPAQATNCLNQIGAFPCGIVNPMNSIGLQQGCIGAFHGSIATGSNCQGNVQCVSGNYCTTPTDGGSGSCAALQPEGGTCSRFDSTECSYLGLGDTKRYCDLPSHSCLPQEPIDAGCTNYQQCVSQLCKPSGGGRVCSGQYVFTDPGVTGGTCDSVTLKDAGHD